MPGPAYFANIKTQLQADELASHVPPGAALLKKRSSPRRI